MERFPMKRGYFVCVFLFLTTASLFSQWSPLPANNRRIRVVPPLSAPRLSPRDQARMLHQHFESLLSFEAMSLNASSIFVEALTYSSGGYDAISVEAADVNGDGRPDLVVINECGSNSGTCSNGTVGVLLGNDHGTFQAAVNYGSGGERAVAVAVADVNGDGKPDLVVANECASGGDCNNGTVGVLLGNGDGTFQAAVTYSSGGYETDAVAVADVNGDGKPDLIVANSCATSNSCTNGAVGVLLGNGDGTFRAVVSYGSGEVYADSVVVADVNGDGKPDLLVANECAGSSSTCNNGTVGVLLGNGDGTFRVAVNYGSGGQDAIGVAVADV